MTKIDTTDNGLLEIFEAAIKNQNFSFLEMKGFMVCPHLALKVGMSMGYAMAMERASEKLSGIFPEPKKRCEDDQD